MDEPKEISEIPYPEELRSSLQRLSPLLIQSMERDGLPIESGMINLGKIDGTLKMPLFFFYWITDLNDIINNLNLVLSDLRRLPSDYLHLSGAPRKRYYLLVRTFFYEFYRFREVFGQAVKGLQKGGYLDKAECEGIRTVFHEAFEGTIKLRNSFVHGSPVWKGENHFNLMLVGGTCELGYALKNKETGKLWDIYEVLKDSCQHMADILRDEGNVMARVLREAVDIFLKFVQYHPQTAGS